MATLTAASQVYDLVSWAKTRDPSFKTAAIAELLNQSNEMVQAMIWLESNMPTAHRITQRVGLPTVGTRQLNSPANVTRGQTAQVDEGMEIMEAWAEYDVDLLKLWSDQNAFLYLQSRGFYEAITQKFARDFWYGDPTVDPTQMLGMAPRYSTVNSANAANAQNVLDAGGTGSVNTSVWLLTVAPHALHGIVPMGSAAGIQHWTKDDQVIQGNTGIGGTRLRVFQEQWQWKAGIALWDWRWCARGANIDTTNLSNQAGAADLTELMVKMTYLLPSISTPASGTGNPTSSIAIPGRQFFVCNRTVRAALHLQMLNKTNSQLTMEDWFGRKVISLLGIPILNSDQILNTEAQVV